MRAASPASGRRREAVPPKRRQVERGPAVEQPLGELPPHHGPDGEAVTAEAGGDVGAPVVEAIDDGHLVRREALETDPAPRRLDARSTGSTAAASKAPSRRFSSVVPRARVPRSPQPRLPPPIRTAPLRACFMLSLRLAPRSTTPSTGGSGAVACIWGAKSAMGSRTPSASARSGRPRPGARGRGGRPAPAHRRSRAHSRSPSRRISPTGQLSHTMAPRSRARLPNVGATSRGLAWPPVGQKVPPSTRGESAGTSDRRPAPSTGSSAIPASRSRSASARTRARSASVSAIRRSPVRSYSRSASSRLSRSAHSVSASRASGISGRARPCCLTPPAFMPEASRPMRPLSSRSTSAPRSARK